MSICRDRLSGLLPEFVHDFLDPEEKKLVEGHLESCQECRMEARVLRQLEDETLPEPPPLFWSTLPGKVVASAGSLRSKRARVLIPVWVGGAASAAILLLMVLLPRSAPELPTNIDEYAAVQPPEVISLGLEDELLQLSESLVDDLDQSLDLEEASELYMAGADLVRGGLGLESMDDDEIRIFEDLVEEMARQRVRKKVTS